MALKCGPNTVSGSLTRSGDADDAMSALELAESLATADVRIAVREFLRANQCPDSCRNRTYDPKSLRVSVRRAWGGPSPKFPGLYQIIVQADYSFVVTCESPQPPAPKPDEPPTPDEVPNVNPGAWFRYCLDVACRHFCLFKSAGSIMKYTHVHITLPMTGYPPQPGDVTGIGHDDNTNPDNPHHSTVSRGDGSCGFETKPDHTTVFPKDYDVREAFTVYFIECGTEGCPPGWGRHECPCGTMCWTLSHDDWESWYKDHHP